MLFTWNNYDFLKGQVIPCLSQVIKQWTHHIINFLHSQNLNLKTKLTFYCCSWLVFLRWYKQQQTHIDFYAIVWADHLPIIQPQPTQAARRGKNHWNCPTWLWIRRLALLQSMLEEYVTLTCIVCSLFGFALHVARDHRTWPQIMFDYAVNYCAAASFAFDSWRASSSLPSYWSPGESVIIWWSHGHFDIPKVCGLLLYSAPLSVCSHTGRCSGSRQTL